ncbi:Pimeloyl-ACP methyl ester carboxylesterase [Salinihabitans flavidus]|uniref:Pimeloyl-ACP methyl ester carboxylesterase n=1 Tax=Salinihabitans flavidus TaxID=569882 RepID=A0A1H8ND43_9RHOB|nr:alpha/beta hydrolase [Salinihabitans flavidus]SEO27534.1 Pimeloyl-ACP methyl ester carboxylesterase [Salinihabitans flavidus]
MWRILALLLLILVAAAVVVTLWRAARHEARAEASHPPEGRLLDVDGNKVHAVVRGSGPDLVLIHGSSGNLRDFTHRLTERLAPHFRVIAFDRPGLGYSDRIDRNGASIVQQARLLSLAAEQLGAETPIVLGHSYGGAVALAWAVHHPDRIAGLVPLSAASHPWDTPLDPYYRLTSHRWLGPLAIPLITAWVDENRVMRAMREVFAPQAPPEGYAAHFGPGLTLRRKSLRANALQRAGLLGEIEALHRRYPGIAVPTEILHGDADTTVGLDIHARPLVRAIPGATLTVLDGIGHMPHHAAQDDVMDALHRVAERAGLR